MRTTLWIFGSMVTNEIKIYWYGYFEILQQPLQWRTRLWNHRRVCIGNLFTLVFSVKQHLMVNATEDLEQFTVYTCTQFHGMFASRATFHILRIQTSTKPWLSPHGLLVVTVCVQQTYLTVNWQWRYDRQTIAPCEEGENITTTDSGNKFHALKTPGIWLDN